MSAHHDPAVDLRREDGKTSEWVASMLRHRIREGALLPGDRLKDAGLAAELGVSRNTVRDGVRRLEQDGLVVVRVHSGASVSVLTEDVVRDIYRVRSTLECAGIDASAHASVEDLQHVSALATRSAAAAGSADWRTVNSGGVAFHGAIVGLLGSAMTSDFFATVLDRLRLSIGLLPDDSDYHGRWAMRDCEIAEAMLRGSRAHARALMVDYLRDSEAQLVDGLRESRARTAPPARTSSARAAGVVTAPGRTSRS